MDKDFDAWFARLKDMCETSTAERFVSRLEGLVLVYAYMERAFQQRFPIEFAAYEAQNGETGERPQ
jgi:hypothetical protein